MPFIFIFAGYDINQCSFRWYCTKMFYEAIRQFNCQLRQEIEKIFFSDAMKEKNVVCKR